MNDLELILIRKSQKGDVDAFEKLIKEYKKTAYNIAYRYVNNVQDAEDLSQDAILKAYKSIKSFNMKSSFKTWLYRIVVNTCLDYRKKKSIDAVSMEKEYSSEFSEYRIQYKDNSPGPEEMLEKKEQRNYIMHMIDNLDDKLKDAVILRDIQNFSYEEISEILECNLGTVKSRISRGRDKLKEQLILLKEGDFRGL